MNWPTVPSEGKSETELILFPKPTGHFEGARKTTTNSAHTFSSVVYERVWKGNIVNISLAEEIPDEYKRSKGQSAYLISSYLEKS